MRLLRPILVLSVLGLLLGLIAIGHHPASPPPNATRFAETDPARPLLELIPPGVKTALWLDARQLNETPALAALRHQFWTTERTQGLANLKAFTGIDLRHELTELVIGGDVTRPDSLLMIATGTFKASTLQASLGRSRALELQTYKGVDLFQLPHPKDHFECIAVFGAHELAAGSLSAVKGLADYLEAKKSGPPPESPIQPPLSALGSNPIARLVTLQFTVLPNLPAGAVKDHATCLAVCGVIGENATPVIQARLDLDESPLAGRVKNFLESVLANWRIELAAENSTANHWKPVAAAVRLDQAGSSLNASLKLPTVFLESLLQPKAKHG